MRYSFLLLLIFSLCNIPETTASTGENIITSGYTSDMLTEAILPKGSFHPFSKAFERKEWEEVPQNIKTHFIEKAEKQIGCEWETPRASVFLEYAKNGNRSRYEAIYFARRDKLTTFVLAECFENKGRYLDDIVNGIWSTCEETYWGFPAHLFMQKRGPGLADVNEPIVDLFAAETGMLLSWTYYLLEKQLDTISPMIRERIAHEVHRRINESCLRRDDYWWMGFIDAKEHHINNWNPWICSNWLTCVLLTEEDKSYRAKSVYKIMQCLDNYLNHYPDDGGCDEGTMYWGVAGGTLYDCLELLSAATNGEINFFDVPKIKKIGNYIYHMHIHDDRLVNFADAHARKYPDAGLLYRYGKSTGNETLKQFAAYVYHQQKEEKNIPGKRLNSFRRIIPYFRVIEEIKNTEAKEPLTAYHWFQETEVMVARTDTTSGDKGLFVAAKGGHNNESHNHNDVGSFIIYADGEPLFIDAGVAVYTKKTFSEKRYELWNNQSAYHNAPTINGYMQEAGEEYKAENVKAGKTADGYRLCLDISGAYPGEAGISKWNRCVELKLSDSVIITDLYQLNKAIEPACFNLMTWKKPVVKEPGEINIAKAGENKDETVTVFYNHKKLDTNIEEIKLTDKRLMNSWGDNIYRLQLIEKEKQLEGNYRLLIVY